MAGTSLTGRVIASEGAQNLPALPLCFAALGESCQPLNKADSAARFLRRICPSLIYAPVSIFSHSPPAIGEAPANMASSSSRTVSPPLSDPELCAREQAAEETAWEVYGDVFVPAFLELRHAEEALLAREKEARADRGDVKKRRCVEEAQEARDLAKVILQSLEEEYGLVRHGPRLDEAELQRRTGAPSTLPQ